MQNDNKDNMISVVIPVYNVSEYVKRCIESVINQTYHNLEIIMVDDGSTDNSGEICEEYRKRDPRVVLVHQENTGLSAARNTGIELATGNYITFVDSDDYIDSDYIEYLFELLVKNDADISLCQSRKIYQNGYVNQTIDDTYDDKVIYGKSECMKEFFLNPYVTTTAWGKLYKTELVKLFSFPAGKYHEDVFTTYKLMGDCDCFVIGKQTKYNYMIRDNSISNKCFETKHLDLVEGKINQYEYVKENYPQCSEFAKADIVYAANCIAIKMINSDFYDNPIVKSLQKIYRKYEKSFLTGISSKKAKLFSVCAFINLKMVIITLQKFRLMNRD